MSCSDLPLGTSGGVVTSADLRIYLRWYRNRMRVLSYMALLTFSIEKGDVFTGVEIICVAVRE